jgi:SAM-dependent methyltransferase
VGGELAAREMMLGTRDPFTYGECEGCGTLVLLDPPADLGRYYPADYYSMRPPRRARLPVRIAKRLRAEASVRGMDRLARAIGRGAAPPWAEWLRIAGLDRSARICDIGCGNGELLFQMRDEGFGVLVGADPFIAAPISERGVEVHKTTAEGLGGEFDLVMLNHALEHVPDPLATLAAARALLAPGGTLLVRVPVAGCWAWRHYGVDWVGLDAPRHLFVPSEGGLRAAFAAIGLEPLELLYDSTEMQFWRSEQYRRDVALFEPASHQVDPRGSPFSGGQLREWSERAEQLNRAGDGDTAAVFGRAG